jgi:hypothetical protein
VPSRSSGVVARGETLLQTNGSAMSKRSGSIFRTSGFAKADASLKSLAPPKIALDPLAHFPETLKVFGVSISKENGGYSRYRLGSTKRDSTATVGTVACCRTDRIYA